MRFLRPASRALSHLLRHDPIQHYSSPASLFSRHSPFAPFTRAFDDPFFSSPFSSPIYTLYEVKGDSSNSNNSTANDSNTKAEQHNKQEEVKASEPQQAHQQQRSTDNRLARQEDSSRQRWLDRRSNRRHPRHHHHNHHHHPLSLFSSPFDSLLSSPFFHHQQPLEISVDLYSTPTAYQVNAAIPGVRKEDIKLTVDDGVLTIEAERREERGRPANKTAAATSSSTDSSSTPAAATSAANAEVPQTEQKAVEVEVKADGVEAKPAAETKAQATQPQQQAVEEDEEEDDVSVHHVESYYGRVQRSLALPEDVNVDGLTARYEDGVLKIELPRIEEKKQQVKQINIQ